MEIWDNVEDLANLSYQGRVIEYPDFRRNPGSGVLIRINGDQCNLIIEFCVIIYV